MTFTYDPTLRRYRNAESGRFVRETTVRSIRQGIIDRATTEVDALSGRLAAGDLSVEDWTLTMRDLVKRTVIDQYLMGRGGRNAMTQRDWGRIGYILRTQYGYLQGFAAEVDAGSLSAEQIAARARMYISATWSVFDRATGAAWLIVLPAQPGEGVRCRGNCRCRWEVKPNKENGTIEATWVLDSGAEHCDDCKRRAEQWAPLVFPAPMPGIDTPITA